MIESHALWGPLKDYPFSSRSDVLKFSGIVIRLTIHAKGQSFELEHVLKFIGVVISRLTINTTGQSFELEQRYF
jgi:hypothetical protein